MPDMEILAVDFNGRERWKIPGGFLVGVHPLAECIGQERCVIHNPTEHHMREWPMGVEEPDGVMTRKCPHGWEHPDPDSLWYFVTRVWDEDVRHIHMCDGCCHAA